MLNNIDKYLSEKGDFVFPNFLYQTLNNLMKSTLDLGTLACSNDAQLRAFKETVKKNFRAKWNEIAAVLQEFELISPCVCAENEYCRICGGSRFTTNEILNSDIIQENVLVALPKIDPQIKKKLEAGLEKAIKEVEALERSQFMWGGTSGERD